MENVALILSIIILVVAGVQVVFVIISIKSNSYLQYRKKLEEYEATKRRVEEEIDNERRKFEQ